MGFEKEQSGADARVLYADLSYRIMAAVFAVHNARGPGFTESIYEQALAREISDLGIPFEQQKPIEVYYKDGKVGDYRLDFLVDGKVILELKALREIPSLFEVQVHSYLKATGMRLGILINFGTKKVEYKRIVLKGKHEGETRISRIDK